jgi:5'-nucleotidase
MGLVLLTNDDGIDSLGLQILWSKLEALGEIVVVAPRTEKSGVGKGLSSDVVKISEIVTKRGRKAYTVTGTPADAVLLAIFKILKEKPVLVVSGINLGPNVGIDDLFTSGTLGAAFEAVIHGIPAVTASYCIERIDEKTPKKNVTLDELEIVANLTREVVEYVLKFGMPSEVDILNINVPAGPDTKHVKFTELSYKGYLDIFKKHKNGYCISAWVLSDYPDDREGTDIHVIKQNKLISITPIKMNFVHYLKGLSRLADFLEKRGYQVGEI